MPEAIAGFRDGPIIEQVGAPEGFFLRGRHVHFMGVGGVGISALARLAASDGARVSGCDKSLNAEALALARLGVRLFEGHSPEHLDGVDLLVHTSAVRDGEPELVAARRLGIEVESRLPMLLRLGRLRRLAGVAGSHGKTTTAAILAWVLLEGGLDPSVALGGYVRAGSGQEGPLRGNARVGKGDWFVAEIDESDGFISQAVCDLAVITNVDRDHLESYGSFDGLCAAFAALARNVPESGTVLVCADSEAALSASRAARGRVVTYGLGGGEFRAEVKKLSADGTLFDLRTPSGKLEGLSLPLPGLHNVQNAVAAAAAGAVLGVGPDLLRRALASAPSVSRRLDRHVLPSGLEVLHDYAHHPSEIAAAVSTARLLAGPRRLLAVFQPHRYTRTAALGEELGRAFAGEVPPHLPGLEGCRVDELLVTDVYTADEEPIPGVSGERVATAAASSGVRCRYIPDRAELADVLQREASPEDFLLILGAGDIDSLVHALRAEEGRREGV